jgi:hypothetical protein
MGSTKYCYHTLFSINMVDESNQNICQYNDNQALKTGAEQTTKTVFVVSIPEATGNSQCNYNAMTHLFVTYLTIIISESNSSHDIQSPIRNLNPLP